MLLILDAGCERGRMLCVYFKMKNDGGAHTEKETLTTLPPPQSARLTIKIDDYFTETRTFSHFEIAIYFAPQSNNLWKLLRASVVLDKMFIKISVLSRKSSSILRNSS